MDGKCLFLKKYFVQSRQVSKKIIPMQGMALSKVIFGWPDICFVLF